MHPQLRTFIFLAGGVFVHGHSWVDSIVAVDCSNQPISSPGYIRNYTGHIDVQASYRIEDLSLNPPICKETQLAPMQGAGFPRLMAKPGSRIQANYTENGHISLPIGDAVTGMTFWYGTADLTESHTFSEVQGWTMDGLGGNRKGRLLSIEPFDDGTCIEGNGSPMALERGNANKPCHSAFTVPTEGLSANSSYTVYWVWNFSGSRGRDKTEHTEFYTSCMDINIIS